MRRKNEKILSKPKLKTKLSVMYNSGKQKEKLKKDNGEEKKNEVYALSDDSQLTLREKEVMVHILEGFTSREIADRLFVCPETIETHRKNIIKKFGVKNTAHAVAHAFRNNLIQ